MERGTFCVYVWRARHEWFASLKRFAGRLFVVRGMRRGVVSVASGQATQSGKSGTATVEENKKWKKIR